MLAPCPSELVAHQAVLPGTTALSRCSGTVEYLTNAPRHDQPLLTKGDLNRGRAPELKSPHWRCGIVDPATGATCTLRPHTQDKQHQGREAVQGAGRSTRIVTWTGGTERAMVVDGYTWTRIPGTDLEVRALTDKPLALRYRPRA
jgi:hypothetical protein